MRIECLIIRDGGSFVDIDGVDYHFKPLIEDKKAAHVAEVEDEDHIARFLSISEGYRIYNPNRKTAKKIAPEPVVIPEEGGGSGNEGGDSFVEDAVLSDGLVPDEHMSKSQLIAWINANMPDLDFNPKLNAGAIRRAITDRLQD